ncbi:MAG TPA: PEP-CTERM sorting domain-containing protein [Pyrinomonadaceae bacterium]|nr:PEP-CTERM sorting domain-containing protein [Pyrinomonadaceae bacterium]
MKKFAAMFKPLAMGIALFAIFGAAQIAKADPLTVSGTSTGTITGTVAQFLSFTGNTFTATTAGGVGAFSGADRIGTFTLSPAIGETPVSGTFSLVVTFTSPTGILAGQVKGVSVPISGTISTTDTGGVQINFLSNGDGFIAFGFRNENGTGTAIIELPRLFVQSGDTADLTAGLRGRMDPIPEPATMILLGTGLAGVAMKIRRRRRNNGEQ